MITKKKIYITIRWIHQLSDNSLSEVKSYIYIFIHSYHVLLVNSHGSHKQTVATAQI